jgi:hypothetical protein
MIWELIMNKSIVILLTACVICLLLSGCGDKPDVQVTFSDSGAADNTVTVVRLNANLLRYWPKTMMEKPDAILMINQGDQITVLETQGDWSRVQHGLSGQIGWLSNSFIQIESKTKWWSGDTDNARTVAEKIFKNKIFLERKWPVIHISIEERWNKCLLTVKQDVEFSKNEATDCAVFIIDQLSHDFPNWRDHQVFIDSSWNGEPYSFVMSDEKIPTFF